MTTHLLYYALRKAQKQAQMKVHNVKSVEDVHDVNAKIQSETCGPVKQKGLMILSEFRFMILTVLLVTSSLTLQHTFEDIIDTYVRSKIKHPGRKIGFMFLLSFILITITIMTVVFWKPVKIPIVL